MALNFPSSPTVGQTHDATNGLSYYYDGVKGKVQGTYDASTSGQQFALDDISSDFNGTTKTFNLHHNSSDISLSSALDVTISIGGVIQEPDDAYTVNPAASTITFSAAPPDGVTFFGILKAKLADTNITVSDGTVTNSKLSGDIAVDKLANGTARQLLQSNSGGDDVEWTSNVDIPGTLDVTGNADIDSDLNVDGSTQLEACGVDGNFDVNTNKFNITAATGNTTIAGTLGVTDNVAVNTNKFNVTAASGNTTIAGTLAVTGKSTFTAGNVFTKVSTTLPDATTFAVTGGWHELTSQSSTTDTIEGITGGVAGQILILTAAATHTITLTDGTDTNDFMLGANIDIVGNNGDTVTLMFNGTNWLKIAHGDN